MGSISEALKYTATQLGEQESTGGRKYKRALEGYHTLRIENGAIARVGRSGSYFARFPATVIGQDGNSLGRTSVMAMVPLSTPTEALETKSAALGETIVQKKIPNSMKEWGLFAKAVGIEDIPPFPKYDRENKVFLTDDGEVMDRSVANDLLAANKTAVQQFIYGVIDQIESAYAEDDVDQSTLIGETPFAGTEVVGLLTYKDESDSFGTVWKVYSGLPTGKEFAGAE